jgi:ribonuclease E
MVGDSEDSSEPARAGGEDDETDQEGRKRRRGRRGGRRRGRNRDNGAGAEGGVAGEALAEGESGEDFASDEAFGPDDPGEQDNAPLTGSFDDNDAGPSAPSYESSAEPDEAPLNDAASLPTVATEQVVGIFGSDAPAEAETAGDGHADEVEALTATTAGNGTPPEAASKDPDVSTMSDPEAVEANGPTTQPVEDNTPKRSGWWNRRSFF